MQNQKLKSSVSEKRRNSKGFSLTEIIIASSLFMILAGLGIGSFYNYYQSSLIKNDYDNVLTLMKNTRFRALKNATDDNYGVFIDVDGNKMTGFRDTYTPGTPDNKPVDLSLLTVSDLSLAPNSGTTNTIIFEKRTGKTANTGSFTLSFDNQDFVITINAQGVID